MSMSFLSAEAGLIFRITHLKNIPWILSHGMHCASAMKPDPEFVAIGNPELIERRARRKVPVAPGGNLSDYVPFYFTPRSPMLYNIKTGWNGLQQVSMSDIVVLSTSMQKVMASGVEVLVADRHAYLKAAQFSSGSAGLGQLDWNRLRTSDFTKDHENPEPFERYQAEALVHLHLSIETIERIVCYGPEQESSLHDIVQSAATSVNVEVHREWFF